jgi:pimeloyl-ACP methyl ester carboxylesterase
VLDTLGFQRFTLVGTSMGGRMAMLYAGKHAERLDRLIINDIGPDPEPGSDRITDEAGSTPDADASAPEARWIMGLEERPDLSSSAR